MFVAKQIHVRRRRAKSSLQIKDLTVFLTLFVTHVLRFVTKISNSTFSSHRVLEVLLLYQTVSFLLPAELLLKFWSVFKSRLIFVSGSRLKKSPCTAQNTVSLIFSILFVEC